MLYTRSKGKTNIFSGGNGDGSISSFSIGKHGDETNTLFSPYPLVYWFEYSATYVYYFYIFLIKEKTTIAPVAQDIGGSLKITKIWGHPSP